MSDHIINVIVHVTVYGAGIGLMFIIGYFYYVVLKDLCSVMADIIKNIKNKD